MKWLPVGLLIVAVTVSCRDDGEPPRSTDTPRARRLLKTPPGKIRAVPPHAIFAGGVGPYKLGTPLNDVLDLVSGGPRIVVVNFDGVLDYHYIPAEEGAIIVGASHSEKPISFISILDPKIAKTKGGVSVGASTAQLRKQLGEPELRRVGLRDPRIVTFAKLPTLQFVVTNGKVRAAMVSGSVPTKKAAEPTPVAPPKQQDEPVKPATKNKAVKKLAVKPKVCRAAAWSKHKSDILTEAGTTAFSNPQIAYGCFVGDAPGALVRDGSRITVVGGEPGKFRVVSRSQIASLTFASAIDVNADQRHEIALTRVVRTRKRIVARVEVIRVEANGRLQRLASKAIYILSRETVEWTGAKLADIELLLALSVANRRLRVGGLYLHDGATGARMMAPLRPVVMKVQTPRPAPRTPSVRNDAGVPSVPRDASVVAPRKNRDAGPGPRPKPKK